MEASILQDSKMTLPNNIMHKGFTSVLWLIRSKHLQHIREAHQRLAADLNELQSTVLPRLQRVERELMDARLDSFFHQLHIAIQLTVRRGSDISEALEKGVRAMAAPLPRGKAGGLARARSAWRYPDGTYIPESEREAAIEQWELAEYERYARGGRRRAAIAQRAANGTFLSQAKLNEQ